MGVCVMGEISREFGEVSLRGGAVSLVGCVFVRLFAGLGGGYDFLGAEILLSAVVFATPGIACLDVPAFPCKGDLGVFICEAAGFWGVCLEGAVVLAPDTALGFPGVDGLGEGMEDFASAEDFAGRGDFAETGVACFNFREDGFSAGNAECRRPLVQFCMQKVDPK